MEYKRWDRIVFKKDFWAVKAGATGVVDKLLCDKDGEVRYLYIGLDNGRYVHLYLKELDCIQLDSKLRKALS